jgi:hypothetical protein
MFCFKLVQFSCQLFREEETKRLLFVEVTKIKLYRMIEKSRSPYYNSYWWLHFSSTRSAVNTQYHCDCTATHTHTQVTSWRNTFTPIRQVFQHSKCNNRFSLTKVTLHLVLTQLVKMRLEIHFPILLCQTIDSLSSGEPSPWQKKCAAQKLFRSIFGIQGR